LSPVTGSPPTIAVVVATRDRAPRLRKLLEALRRQTLDPAGFEVIVVDDGSDDNTPRVLEEELERGVLPLRTLRNPRSAGPGPARDRGWRMSSAPIVAFTDDDCEPAPGWLFALRATGEGRPGSFVQGRTEPNPDERGKSGPFTRTMEVTGLDENFPTCNIAYPRSLLERIDGFDVAAFERFGGEDCDLAWRAIGAGATPVFCEEALVHHAVNDLGPAGKLRAAAQWSIAMKAYAVHPQARRATFVHRIFWKRDHYLLARALIAALLPRRLAALRAWLAYPYARSLWARGQVVGGGPALAPYYLLHDVVEAAGVAWAGIRHRTPMI